jgi:putative peptidoglycan lipid II flippase
MFSTALVVAAATTVAKGAGAAKELVVAFRLGTSPELGAFLVAYMFPAFLINVISGSVQVALVPRYLVVQHERGPAAAAELAARMGTVVLVLLLGFVLLATPVLSTLLPAVASGFDAPTLDLSRHMLALLMPIVCLNGVASLWSGVLNAERRFVFTSLVPLATPVCVGIAMVALYGSMGVYALVAGTLAGAAIEAFLLATGIRRRGLALFGSPRMRGRDERDVFRQFLPVAGSNVLMAATALVEQSFAAGLSASTVAAYSFGTRVTTVVSGIAVTTISTLLLPHFARVRAAGTSRDLQRSALRVAVGVGALGVAFAVLLGGAALPITEFLYQRGRFTAEDTLLVATVQVAHAAYVPLYSVAMVAVRILNAVESSSVLLVGAVLNLASCVALNLVLTPQWGVAGIAWSSVGTSALACVFLWWMAFKRMRAP